MENNDNHEHITTENANRSVIRLDKPIMRGGNIIPEITLRKPGTPELRGTTLSDVLQLDVRSIETILPRITTPKLTKQEVAEMDPADLTECASKVAAFLLKKEKREELSLTE